MCWEVLWVWRIPAVAGGNDVNREKYDLLISMECKRVGLILFLRCCYTNDPVLTCTNRTPPPPCPAVSDATQVRLLPANKPARVTYWHLWAFQCCGSELDKIRFRKKRILSQNCVSICPIEKKISPPTLAKLSNATYVHCSLNDTYG